MYPSEMTEPRIPGAPTPAAPSSVKPDPNNRPIAEGTGAFVGALLARRWRHWHLVSAQKSPEPSLTSTAVKAPLK
jgi:hypothetical protein